MFPIEKGMKPESLFIERSRMNKFFRFPIEEGMELESLLSKRERIDEFLRFSIEEGILPVKSLFDK
jgi:hypothetical protein